jgi:HAD superfamily hydrolase (TIGR01549 family)
MKAAIFDIDGTLIDSVNLHATAWQEAFAHFGKEISFEDIRSQIGKGADQLLPVFLTKEELKTMEQELTDFRSTLFKEKYLAEVKPFPKVRELFLRIRDDGKRIALASSGKKDEVENYMKIAHIEDLIDTSTSSDDADRSKPKPDIFEAALEKLKLPPEETIVIGDTPYDAIAARKAGIPAIGVLCGGFPEEDLRKEGCKWIYKDPEDLLERYEKSPLNEK